MAIGHNKKIAFQSLLDRVQCKIGGWCYWWLSQGGKLVFIKSLLQAIPMYVMSCFLLPKMFCEKIEAILNCYWWQKTPSMHSIHWCR